MEIRDQTTLKDHQGSKTIIGSAPAGPREFNPGQWGQIALSKEMEEHALHNNFDNIRKELSEKFGYKISATGLLEGRTNAKMADGKPFPRPTIALKSVKTGKIKKWKVAMPLIENMHHRQNFPKFIGNLANTNEVLRLLVDYQNWFGHIKNLQKWREIPLIETKKESINGSYEYANSKVRSSSKCIQDLPDEIILKVINYLHIKDLIKCGQVSKRIREISFDESLWQKLNFSKLCGYSYNHFLPIELVNMVLKNGCRYLGLEDTVLGSPLELSIASNSEGVGSSVNLSGKEVHGTQVQYITSSLPKIRWAIAHPVPTPLKNEMCSNKVSKLRYLDMKDVKADEECFEEILGACHSLQKLSMACSCVSKTLTKNMIESICYQNGKTLETLNLSGCGRLHFYSIQKIINNCNHLKNVDFFDTHLSEDSIEFLANNLTSKVEKLNLGCLTNMTDDHVKTLVRRCDKLSVLILQNNWITNSSLTHIIKYLPNTLEKLDVLWCYELTYNKLMELKSMPSLKVLNCLNHLHKLSKELHIEEMPGVRFNEEISADEREFSSNEGIWNIASKQILYRKVSHSGKTAVHEGKNKDNLLPEEA